MKKLIHHSLSVTSKIIYLLLIVCLAFPSCSKDEDTNTDESTISCNHDQVASEIFTVVEEMPRYPGCENQGLPKDERTQCAQEKMLQFVYDNLEYPAEAEANNIEGTGVVRFTVESDGCVTNCEIIKDLEYGTGAEMKRIIGLMPRWIPGRQRDEAVAVYFNLPIRFRL